MAKIDISELKKRSEYIKDQKHPTLDLLIWNYTQSCQFAGAWDEYTIQCRGLITDIEGGIVARPFKKFFNVGDEKNAKMPPDIKPIIYPKFDGSLGILYWEGDRPAIATRGSFSSDQALWATNWIRSYYVTVPDEDFDRAKTYLFEIIYPENRIVVDYRGMKGLVLLAVIDIETGDEIPLAHEDEAIRLGLDFAQHIKYLNQDEIIEQAKTLDGNEEGWVFHWPTAGNVRLKIKGDEYVRLVKRGQPKTIRVKSTKGK